MGGETVQYFSLIQLVVGGLHSHVPWGFHIHVPWGIHVLVPGCVPFHVPGGFHIWVPWGFHIQVPRDFPYLRVGTLGDLQYDDELWGGL